MRFPMLLLLACLPQLLLSSDNWPIDIEHYLIKIELNEGSDKIEGTATLTCKLKNNCEQIPIDLIGPAGGKGMLVHRVTINGETKPIKWEQKSEQLWVHGAFSSGELIVLSISYSGIPGDGLFIGENRHGEIVYFGDNWPKRARHWFPCHDHPSDKASVRFFILAPSRYQVVANGALISRRELGNGKAETIWQSEAPLPTKVMVFGAAPFSVDSLCTLNNIPITSWVFKEEAGASHFFNPSCGIVQWMDSLVAPYPFQKLANVQSKTRYGGMENASCIFYFENCLADKERLESLIAHEIAHQWFGNTVTEASWSDLWLSEGFATYFTDLWFEKQDPQQFLNRLKAEREQVLKFHKMYQAPVKDSAQKNLRRLLNPNAYQKGAWVLHMLRNEIGDEAFFEGIRAYFNEYREGNASSINFIQMMESASERDLTPFFNQWLRSPGHPVISLSWKEKKKGKLELKIEQNQDQLFAFKLDVAFLNEQNELISIRGFTIDQKKERFLIDKPESVAHILLDPETKLLFEELSN